jgi:hypothetical protein
MGRMKNEEDFKSEISNLKFQISNLFILPILSILVY